MEALLELGRGPLFRLCFALLVLGLARIVFLAVVGMAEGGPQRPKGSPDANSSGRPLRQNPVYAALVILFHAGLIIVPLFLVDHVLLWDKAVGFAWLALPPAVADALAILVISTGVILLLRRLVLRVARRQGRPAHFAWPPLLLAPFVTGYLCSHAEVSAASWQWLMLIHLYSANLIMAMIPFTGIAECVLQPFSQFVAGFVWRFPLRPEAAPQGD